MRKESHKFSKANRRTENYATVSTKHSGTVQKLVQIPAYTASDDEEYYFEVEDY
jgi:hypothetical protein